jgi:hypothetical protein
VLHNVTAWSSSGRRKNRRKRRRKRRKGRRKRRRKKSKGRRKTRRKRKKGRRRRTKIVAVVIAVVVVFVAVLWTSCKYHEQCYLEYLIRSVFLIVPENTKHLVIRFLCQVTSSDA